MPKHKSLIDTMPRSTTYYKAAPVVEPIYDDNLALTTEAIKNALKSKPYEEPLQLVNPEFDIISAAPFIKTVGKYAVVKASNKLSNAHNLVDDVLERTIIGRRTLPKDMAYRRTMKQEIDDIIESNSIRDMPKNMVIKTDNPFAKVRGYNHGGKAFSKGKPWEGTTSGSSSEYIYGVPGDQTKWRVGFHGHYSAPQDFNAIEEGKGLWLPFNEKTGVVDGLSTEGLKIWKKLPTGRYKRY